MWISHPLRTLVPSLDGAVLEALAGTTLPLNAALIARVANTGSMSGIRLVLSRLERDGLVRKDRTGRGYFSANREHLLWSTISAAFELSASLWTRIDDEIAGWDEPPISLAVFGSVARGEDRPESDLDLLIVWSETSHEKTIGTRQHELGQLIEEWTGTQAQFYSVTRDALRVHARSDEPIFREWTRDARTIFGQNIDGVLKEAARDGAH